MILNKKAIWFLLFIPQEAPESNWLYMTSLSDMEGVVFEVKSNIQSFKKLHFTILI